jgi:hypothetical protein
MVCGHFNSYHIHCIREIENLDVFTGTASVGIALNSTNGHGAIDIVVEQEAYPGDDIANSRELLDLQEDEDQDEQEWQVANDIIDILTVSLDDVWLKD